MPAVKPENQTQTSCSMSARLASDRLVYFSVMKFPLPVFLHSENSHVGSNTIYETRSSVRSGSRGWCASAIPMWRRL
jgi:hypothetical protein